VSENLMIFKPFDVKKPACPARESGDEWPKWLFL